MFSPQSFDFATPIGLSDLVGMAPGWDGCYWFDRQYRKQVLGTPTVLDIPIATFLEFQKQIVGDNPLVPNNLSENDKDLTLQSWDRC